MASELGGTGTIRVLAGTNGAGKSSVAGETLRAEGADYFNPDEATQRILAANPGIPLAEANSVAWLRGKKLLERAIAHQENFFFETTLGGKTITSLLEQAADHGLEVHMLFVALATPELHIARVRARVAKGGHDIPAQRIRERYRYSRLNLLRLLPKLTVLRLYDNSADADPAISTPSLLLILRVDHGRILEVCPSDRVPAWAKGIVMAAIRLYGPPPR